MQLRVLNSEGMTTLKLSIYMVIGMRFTGLVTDKSLALRTISSTSTLQKTNPMSKTRMSYKKINSSWKQAL
jgi:hypothetical protein